MTQPPTCPYCGEKAVMVDSSAVYSKSYGMIWLCRPCMAWVGCHKGTTRPLGRLANKTLRKAKVRAHEAFDQLWRSGALTRTFAYEWLAKQMGLSAAECHIGMFDVEQCERVVAIIEACKHPIYMTRETP